MTILSNVKFQVEDFFSNFVAFSEYPNFNVRIGQIKRTSLSEDKRLELYNAKKDRGYALKIDGEDIFKFVVSTSNFEENYDRNIIVGDEGELPRNISINVPLKFLSTLIVKGTVYTFG